MQGKGHIGQEVESMTQRMFYLYKWCLHFLRKPLRYFFCRA